MQSANEINSEESCLHALKIPSAKSTRYEFLAKTCVDTFKETPAFFTRAPGRVNLIGEHIDYCGYSVLPMALDQDIVIAVKQNAPDRNTICIHNVQPKYSSHTSSCDVEEFFINPQDPQWYQYILCGIKGALQYGKLSHSVPMSMMVDGTVPPGAGLSSSSALVCAAALATAYANNIRISLHQLAEVCQSCERYIGTEGGGMDQAISMLAQPGTAKLIDFNPLTLHDAPLPSAVSFVVANSCTESNKAQTAHFNTRVAECRLASQVLAVSNGLEWRDIRTLSTLQKKLNASLDDMVKKVQTQLHEAPYTKTEICERLGVTNEQLNEISLSAKTHSVEVFHLYQRALHVYSEAARVHSFHALAKDIVASEKRNEGCENNENNDVRELGKLMTESHASCRDLYQCSCCELDTLVDICLDSGALGSRLTGAGWGGCAVSMVMTSDLDAFISKVKDKYYKGHLKVTDNSAARWSEWLFGTVPAGGACLYEQTA